VSMCVGRPTPRYTHTHRATAPNGAAPTPAPNRLEAEFITAKAHILEFFEKNTKSPVCGV
jgi:hypothetical protein